MDAQVGRADFLSLPMLQRQNLSERVVQILKHFILDQELQAGDRLPPERQLAEALSHLIGEGLVYRATPRKLHVADFDRGKVSAELAGLREEETSLQHLI